MSDSKENVDVLKMYGEDSTTQRDEFLIHQHFLLNHSYLHPFTKNI